MTDTALEQQLTDIDAELAALQATDLDSNAAFEVQALGLLLTRARRQRPAVAQRLTAKIARRIDALKAANSPSSSETCKPAGSPTLFLLKSLSRQLEPIAEAPARDSSGMAFDEYLQLQEDEVMLAWATRDGQLNDDSLELASDTPTVTEMKAVRFYREQRLKRHADNLVNLALAEAPEDPGPLNPQMLVIKALSNFRDLSPHYLNRFVSYIDTLLCLESAIAEPEPKRRKAGSRQRK